MDTTQKLNPVVLKLCHFLASASVVFGIIFVINNFLIHGLGLMGVSSLGQNGVSTGVLLQSLLILAGLGGAWYFTSRKSTLAADAAVMDRLASTIIAVAFWSVLFVGAVDAVLSFLRIEGLHVTLFGEDIARKIGLSSWRGVWVHIPLMLLAVVIGVRDRSVSVVWLILLVVLAELLIVIGRFIFAYEQTFMGDLVRFWYAALFLFASAFTLKEEGHVRVDVFFANFTHRTKALMNTIGTVAFGIPLCWVVLWRGLSGRTSLINGPMLNFETAASGFGMYVKYLMAAFLIVFALSMLSQFTAYLFNALAVLNGETASDTASGSGVSDTGEGAELTATNGQEQRA